MKKAKIDSSENETQLKFADWSEKLKRWKLSIHFVKWMENSSLSWIQFNVERLLNKNLKDESEENWLILESSTYCSEWRSWLNEMQWSLIEI